MVNETLQVTHVNIRLSITIMLFKLIFVEIVAAALVIIFHSALFLFNGQTIPVVSTIMFTIPLFLALITLKTAMSVFIILQWLNEYYEITPKMIFHPRGFLLKKEAKYPLSQIGMVDVRQTLLGRFFNFGTIGLFDLRRNKYEDMYLIHNPMRYAEIIEHLLPQINERKEVVREHIVERNVFDPA